VKAAYRIFTTKTNGFACAEFHKLCDNNGPTLILIKYLDRVFGGFTTQTWWGTSNFKRPDPLSFLFSVNESLKFPPKTNMSGIFIHSTYGPVFGELSTSNSDLHVPAVMSDDCYSVLGNSYTIPEGMPSSILAGISPFKPEIIEFFKVIL
jgi:hypothetical protein